MVGRLSGRSISDVRPGPTRSASVPRALARTDTIQSPGAIGSRTSLMSSSVSAAALAEDSLDPAEVRSSTTNPECSPPEGGGYVCAEWNDRSCSLSPPKCVGRWGVELQGATDGSAVPADNYFSEESPAEGPVSVDRPLPPSAFPAEGGALSAEGGALSAEGGALSAEGGALSAEAAECPSVGAGMAGVSAQWTQHSPLTDSVQVTERTLDLPGLPASRARHVDTNGRYLVAKAATAATLLVWRLEEENGAVTAHAQRSIPLVHPRVECLSLQDDCGHLLVTCSRTILLWDLAEPGRPAVTLGEDFSGVSCCHLSAGGEAAVAGGAAVLALGVAHSVWLLDTARVRRLATLRGHRCDVSSVTVDGGLCTAGSEAGHLQVWELTGYTLLYSCHSTAARPVGAVAVTADLLASGCGSLVSAAAQVAGRRWTDVTTTPLDRVGAACGGRGSPQPECAVLAVRFWQRPSGALFGPDRLLVVVTTDGLRVLNTRTWLPLYAVNGTGDGEPWGGSSAAVTPGGAAVVCCRSALEGHVSAFCLTVRSGTDEAGDPADRLRTLSIVCRDPLPARSVLRARLPRAAPAQPAPSRVRSSGYGAAPRRAMFQPRTNATRSRTAKTAASKSSLSSLPTAAQRPAKSRDRHLDRPAPKYECHVSPPPVGSRPVRILRSGDTLLRIALSGSGRHVACASQQGGSLEVARLQQLEATQGQFLLGTQGAITSVAWSLSGRRLAASSAAGVQLWSFPEGEPCGRRPAGSHPYTAAQFFFTDGFLLASRGDTVELSRLPPEGAAGGRGRGAGPLRSALQCRLPCREVLHVTSGCQLRSALAVACCSDRALRLIDMQTGRVALTLADAHRRPAHVARLCEGSPHLPAALPLYDLIGSAAVGDGVRLWDARCGRLAARLPAAELRALPAGFQFSPCGRLVALGSDAAHLWLWDVRSGRGPLARLRAAAAGVTDVAFLPRRPGLVAALLDGRLQTWPLDGGRTE
ncbi:uncharacterized protein LOC122370008 isoform X2 [Amphibalanus amphitrite]|uniref:uncharacterized protein LOC122370008 isoform X2 n=1 Tax=Amphibalanus amphitrite TaxID=1232801 RepID=UPI001C901642|nr:uncharacterized protein LOC122370008 isoform X2 [Amphibalanus amphitrite]